MKRLLAAGSLGFFLAALVASTLLTLSYPSGILTVETSGYAEQARHFGLFQQNPLDWLRPPGFPWWLRLAYLTSCPSRAVLSANFLLFSLNCGLVFLVGCRVLGRLRWGALLAAGFLVCEVLWMQSFFLNLDVTSDAFCAELLLLSCLLACLAMAGEARICWWSACALAGFLPLIRWACILVPLAWVLALKHSRRLRSGLPLLLLWTFLWCLRNFWVYGYFSPGASTSYTLITGLTVASWNDGPLFEDPEVECGFRTAVERVRQQNHLELTLQQSAARRMRVKIALFPWTRSGLKGSPFEFLASQVPNRSGGSGAIPHDNSARMFEVDRGLRPMAVHMVLSRPWKVLALVAQNYHEEFVWHSLGPSPGEVYRLNPELVYRHPDMLKVAHDYPELCGRDRPRSGAFLVLNPIGRLSHEPLWNELWAMLEEVFFGLGHLLFLVALWAHSRSLEARVYCLLFGSGAAGYLITGLLEPALLRYAMGSQMLLLVAYLGALIYFLKKGWRRSAVDQAETEGG